MIKKTISVPPMYRCQIIIEQNEEEEYIIIKHSENYDLIGEKIYKNQVEGFLRSNYFVCLKEKSGLNTYNFEI